MSLTLSTDDTAADEFAPSEPPAAPLHSTSNDSKFLRRGDPLTPGVHLVHVSLVSPSSLNMRSIFNDEDLDRLANDIKANGILQPLAVRLISDEWGETLEIIAGERRYRAARKIGLNVLPVSIRVNVSDADLVAMALSENIARADLTPIEEARGYAKLRELEPDLTMDTLAGRVGQSQGNVSKTLALLRLPDAIQEMIGQKLLSRSHGYALATLTERAEWLPMVEKLASEAYKDHWPLLRLEEAIKTFRSAEEARTSPSLPFEEAPASPPSQPLPTPPEPTKPVAEATPAPGRPPVPGLDGPAEPPKPTAAATPDALTKPVETPSAAPEPEPAQESSAEDSTTIPPAGESTIIIPPDKKPVQALLWDYQNEYLTGQGLSLMTAVDRFREINISDDALNAARYMALAVNTGRHGLSTREREVLARTGWDGTRDITPAEAIEALLLVRFQMYAEVDPANAPSTPSTEETDGN